MQACRRALIVAGAGVGLALVGAGARAVMSAAEEDESLARDEDYAAGVAAIRAGDFAAALPRLAAALKRFPESANLHNELGFTQRKLGRFDKAFEHYRRALAIDPRHRGAHEYIGEAYLEVGDLAGAEKHLAELGALCLLPCEEQDGLRRAIAEHRARTAARR